MSCIVVCQVPGIYQVAPTALGRVDQLCAAVYIREEDAKGAAIQMAATCSAGRVLLVLTE